MNLLDLNLPEKFFQKQKVMLRVSYALIPLVLASIYFFGWRSLGLIITTLVFGITTEAVFSFRQGNPISSAVFVTCLIFALSLPPTLPFWIAAVGIIISIGMGKMLFGGFGQNVFNPAMVGRCFIYVSFPAQMTNSWIKPFKGMAEGFGSWSASVDAVTTATPMMELKQGVSVSLSNLFMGNIPGSLGETSGVLILLCGGYLLYKKAAPWRLALSCLLGGVLLSSLLSLLEFSTVPAPIPAILSGSFLFGTMFVVTEPVTGAKTKPAQWIYGFIIGGLTMVLRGFSNFPEGFMFSVLLMNSFTPLLDQIVLNIQTPADKGIR